jgi:carboxymethylenebutenolidase
METADQILPTSGGEMRLYEAKPDGAAKGAVIVIMEAFGVNDHIEDVTRRIATAGFHGVSPDLFHRGGGGTVAYDDFPRMFQMFESVSDDGSLVDVDAALDYLEGHGFHRDQIGIIGFCWGGRLAFLTASRRAIGASVSFYGGGIVAPGGLPFDPLIEEAKSLKTPWLGIFGERDQSIPIAGVEELSSELDRANPVPHEVVRYDADHGFHCDARPDAYDADSAKDAWARAIAWFETHLA